MSDNQTQYSEEFLQQVEELKKEIKEVLQDKSLSEEDKTRFDKCLHFLSNNNMLERKYAFCYSLLGFFYEQQNDFSKAINCFKKVQEKHFPKFYTISQFILGLIYYRKNELTETINSLQKVQKEFDLGLHFSAQRVLAIIFASQENSEEYEKCMENLKNYSSQAKDVHISNILDKISNDKIILKYKEKLLKILDNYLDIRDKLQVVKEENNEKENPKQPERAFAHYTEVDSAINLLKNKEKKEPSKIEKEWNFRMASVEQLNDPMEGQVLFEFLNNYSEQLKQQNIVIEKSEEWAVFTACFTFNHDSLNQFRLYGKKQNQEVTGVSLVFQPSFFSSSHSGIMNNEQGINNSFNILNITQTTLNNDDMEQHNKQDEKTLLLPLYRCIYLDPESFMENEKGEPEPYLKIAARDELTFYREKDKKVNDFKKYKTEIEKIEKEVLKFFKEMIKNIEILFSNLNKNENNEEILNTLGLILLPLSHLIKHSAFHEEQECRIIYCCPFDDEDIDKKESHKAKIFREYRPIINEKDIARIYLSKGAENYAHIFKSLGIKTVRVSSNPFRTAEKE